MVWDEKINGPVSENVDALINSQFDAGDYDRDG